jgi:hypothetical protein
VQIEGVRLVLLNDYNGRSVPLVDCVLTPVAVSSSGTVRHAMIESEIGAAIDMYNASLCSWEPLVEPCTLRISASLQGGGDDDEFKQFRIEAPQPCNLNLSSAMCELLSQSVLTLHDDVTGAVALHTREDEPFVQYAVSNHTGVPLRYGRARAGAPEALLVPGMSEAFNFWPEASDRHTVCNKKRAPSSAIMLSMEGWTLVDEVPIELVGRRIYEVLPSKPVTQGSEELVQAGGVCMGSHIAPLANGVHVGLMRAVRLFRSQLH